MGRRIRAPVHCCLRTFCARQMRQVVKDGIGNRVGAAPSHSLIGKPLAISPCFCYLLSLPEIEDHQAVGLRKVVGKAKLCFMVLLVANVAASDPGSAFCSFSIPELQSLVDLDEIWCGASR